MIRRLPLRQLLPGTAMVFAALVTAALVINVVVTTSLVEDVTRNADVVAREDSLADSLVATVDRQRLAAVHYVRTPNAELIEEFESRGQETYDIVRQYLFLPMPLASRVQIEEIKEVHEGFEVAARQAFSLVSMDPAAARTASEAVAARAREMADAVQRFVATRRSQHAALRAELTASLASHRRASVALAVAVLVIALLLAHFLRLMVLRPLEDLGATLARLGAGEASARVSAGQRFSEFALVADAFNRMADAMEQSRHLIEQKNQALTAALNDLRHAQTELVQREKLSAVGEMLAGLAHELNNPLAAVMTGAESMQVELAEAKDPAVRRLADELAQPVVSAALRARDLVRNLLRFSRQSEGGQGPVELGQAVMVAIGLRKHAFRQAGKQVTSEILNGVYVLGDSQKLQHIFLNLIGNALDALTDGGGSGVRIRARFEGVDWVEVAIEDDGPGFADPTRAFQPFYTTKAVGKGTGLGLAIVHRFVHECAGTIRIENQVDGGARIILRLRAMAPMPLQITSATPEPARPVSVRGGPTVLVVEDEHALRNMQERMLKRLGVNVILVENGAAARDLLLTRSVDLVISDLRMPGEMDGFALLKWLRAERPGLAETALVVSGDLESADLVDRGVDPMRLIAKPFERDDYLRRVAAALDLGQRVREDMFQIG